MKTAIVYYSYSGNTRKVAEILAEALKEKSSVDLIDLQALDESNSFLGQCRRAIVRKKGKIAPVKLDLSAFDLICFGTPVWAFGPAPAINAYLEQCTGLSGKEVILFTTYGSGAGKERCVNYMQDILSRKGTKSFKRFSIQQFKVKDRQLVLAEIEKGGISEKA
ncbi:MAG: flavodoxin family protein [Candidatus Omnitrophica bacterium]|nr:flavodoxin family protein [Candidatus Omnitrophota bacterium]MBU1869833.1 flavodoxin family protein [Candidatus Omnitrophota bacterium]